MRVFIGIDLPYELKQKMVGLQTELRTLGASGYWKSPDNFHITLEFLGEVNPNAAGILTEILSKIVQNTKPFLLSIRGLGAFPSMQRPNTLWTGVKGNLSELHRLRDELHVELARQGFVLENRRFKPHITLASRPELQQIDLSKLLTKEMGEFMVEEVVLFESRAEGRKRFYTDIFKASFPSR